MRKLWTCFLLLIAGMAGAATTTMVDSRDLSSCAYIEQERKTVCNHIHAEPSPSGPPYHVEWIIIHKANHAIQCMRWQLYWPDASIPGGRNILERGQIGAGVCQ